MEKLRNLNLDDYFSPIKEGIVKIVGERHREPIEERVNSVASFYYTNFWGLDDYSDNLLKIKKYELAARFFETIGIQRDMLRNSETNNIYYEVVEELMKKYFYSEALNYPTIPFGVFSFKDNDSNDMNIAFQIEFFNSLFFNGEEIITKNNYSEFKKESVYNNFILDVDKWIIALENDKKEYIEYKKIIEKEFKKPVRKMRDRYEIIALNNIAAVYEYIEPRLPKKLQDLLKKKYRFQIDRNFILGDLDDDFGFACFNAKSDDILLNGTDKEKLDVKYKRIKYFKDIGFLKLDNLPSLEQVSSIYDKVMMSEEIQNLVPAKEIILELSQLKEEIIKKSIGSLILEDEAYNSSISKNNVSYENKLEFANSLSSLSVFCTSGRDDVGTAVRLLFYTIRVNDVGNLDALLIHELIHVIHIIIKDDNYVTSGFDIMSPFGVSDIKNPYNDNYRISERFNEVVVDILTEKVLDYLHNVLGIYLLEDVQFVREYKDRNTSSILRNVVRPFVSKYFDLINDACIEGNMDIIYNRIGKDNLEKLIDSVNYIDSLITSSSLKNDIMYNNFSSPCYIEYLSTLEKVMDIYDAMDKFGRENKKVLTK